MNLTISSRTSRMDPDIEVVERKGRGHPDTLADGLAERLSARYSRYTLDEFGVILNHNFDKVGLLGGQSSVVFGSGRMLRPVRVLLNGRASDRYEDQSLQLQSMLTTWAAEFLMEELPLLDVEREVEFYFNVSTANTPGYPADDFTPASGMDLQQLFERRSSDTAVVCAHYPPTRLERAVLAIEEGLTSNSRREEWRWLGSDIKILALRERDQISMTACVPQIANEVPSLEDYRRNLVLVREVIEKQVVDLLGGQDVELHLNTLDDDAGTSVYLTAIGSCVESGDEGFVGRGNRPSGVIAPLRSHSGEAACGKNPAFFPGKVYTAAAAEIARLVYLTTDVPVEVWLAAQEGRPLTDPWKVVVMQDGPAPDRDIVERIIADTLEYIPELTNAMIDEQVRLR